MTINIQDFVIFFSFSIKHKVSSRRLEKSQAPKDISYILWSSETDEIDECPEKITLNELSANSFAFIFRNSSSISANSESVLLRWVQFLNRRIENQ